MGALNVYLANATAYAVAIAALMDGECTIAELVQESGLGVTTVRKLVAALRRREIVYVAAWEKDRAGRSSIAAYAIGRGHRDVRRPSGKSAKQRKTEYDARRRLLALERGATFRETRMRAS